MSLVCTFAVAQVVNQSDLTLSVLKTVEADGSYTLYKLVNKKLNKPIEGSLFRVSKR